MAAVVAVLTELDAALEFVQPRVVTAVVAAGERVVAEAHQVIVVRQPIQVHLVALQAFVGRVQAVQLAVQVGRIQCLDASPHGPSPKRVDVPIFAFPDQFPAFERAAGVGPIQRRNQPLRTVRQFLPADPRGQLATPGFRVEHDEVQEQILHLRAVLFDQPRCVVLEVARGIEHFAVEPHATPQFGIDIQPSPVQQEIIVGAGQAQSVRDRLGGADTSLGHLPQTVLPADVDDRPVGETHPFEMFTHMPVAVAGGAEVIEVVLVEQVLVRRCGGFLQGFLFFTTAAVAFPAFASGHGLLLPAGRLGIDRRDRLHGGRNRRQFGGLAGFLERGLRLRTGKDRLRVGAGYHQRRQPAS